MLREESERELSEISLTERFEFIRANREKYRVAKMCEVLEVSRSGYYAREKRPKSAGELENEELKE